MTDLVKRLRSDDISFPETCGCCAQAADRIEALEKALRAILDWDEDLPLRIQWIARAALTPEQDK